MDSDRGTSEIKIWLESAETFLNALPQGIAEHCRRVCDVSRGLAERYDVDPDLAALGGLLHDVARGVSGPEMIKFCQDHNIPVGPVEASQPVLLHGVVGAETVRKELGIDDESLLAAITWHSTGREGMSILEKIVFLADKLDPGKAGYYPPGLEGLPGLAEQDLDRALLMYYDWLLYNLIQSGRLIHTATIEARNYVIERLGNTQNRPL